MYFGFMHKINGGIKLNVRKGIIGEEVGILETIETIESDLEELTLHVIDILKDYKKRGLIGEEEYRKHIRVKEEYLIFIQEKRKGLSDI